MAIYLYITTIKIVVAGKKKTASGFVSGNFFFFFFFFFLVFTWRGFMNFLWAWVLFSCLYNEKTMKIRKIFWLFQVSQHTKFSL